jgi:5,10-methylene-tetrahydrofolate dehydrogenase/methenyl tetrahydrofolate cyclohydrolase
MLARATFKHFARGTRAFSAALLDGKACSTQIWDEVAAESKKLSRPPGLAVLLVGARPDSKSYVSLKKKAAVACGFKNLSQDLPENTTQEALMREVQKLNNDPNVDGILIQLPLPAHIKEEEVLEAITQSKDVDGFHPYNMGVLARLGQNLRQAGSKFESKDACNVPCTPLGCIELLERNGVKIAGRHAVVLGRSNIVGLPMAMLLLHKDATVQLCHSRTPNLEKVCQSADILVAAIGKPEMVKASWVKPGAVVLDVGVNFQKDEKSKSGKRMCGDVDFPEVSKVASMISPVPGGVGPMTVAMLMRNTLANAKRHLQSK